MIKCEIEYKRLFNLHLLLIIIISAIVTTSSAAAITADYYLAPWGENSNNGTSLSSAWGSPSYAVSHLSPGSTLWVVNGTYYDTNTMAFTTSNDGTSTLPVLVTAYNGTPIIDGLNSNNLGLSIAGSGNYDVGYITISNIVIRNYRKIFDIRNSQNITLNGVEVFGSNLTLSEGLGQIGTSRNIVVNNSSFHDPVGYNSLEIIGQRLASYTGLDTYNVLVTNNRFYNNNKHASLQIDEYTRDITVSKNHFWNNTGAGSSLVLYKHDSGAQPVKNFTIKDNLIENSSSGFVFYEGSNGLVENMTVNNALGYGMDFVNAYPSDVYTLNNITFRNITINYQQYHIYLAGGKDILFDKIKLINSTYSYDWRIQGLDGGNITIRDELEPEYTLILVDNANSTIEYSNGTVFKYTLLSGTADKIILPAWYPDKSNFSVSRTSIGSNIYFNIQTYPMTVHPSSDPATVTMNSFNTALPTGQVLVNFTANTNNGNSVTFTVSSLKSNTNYIVNKNGALFATLTADSTGTITFGNSAWPSGAFTVQEGISTTVVTPNFSPPAGIYPDSQIVSISTTTSGALIYYTIDGTTPTQNSTLYLTPIIILANTTLKVKAWKTGLNASAIATAIYTISPPTPTPTPTVTPTPSPTPTPTPTPPVLSTITVVPSTAFVGKGSSQQFAAQPKDQNGNSISVIITWNSSNTTTGIINSTGLFTAINEGTSTITATSGSVSGSAIATVISPPGIISWGNTKTNNQSNTISVNKNESVRFNVTANQIITAWNWFSENMSQFNNYDNFTTSWSSSGIYNVSVNAANANGTSSNITWIVTVYNLVDLIPPTITIKTPESREYSSNIIPLTYYADEPIVVDCSVVVDLTENQSIPTCANMSAISREYAPTSSTAAWWHFNENAGNLVEDSSGNVNTGTKQNASWTTGKFGSAMQFDGSTSYIEVQGSNVLDGGNQITVETWVKPILGARGSIVAKYAYNSTVQERVYELDIKANGTVGFALSSNGTGAGTVWLSSSNAVTDNAWNHIAATSDGTALKIYINGELDPNTISAPTQIRSSSYGLQIGAWRFDPSGAMDTFFNGTIDEVRILKKALTQEEIKADYALGEGLHNVTVYAKDISGNSNYTTAYFTINLRIPDTIPPTSITSLQNSTYAQKYINWTWTDSADADFSKVMVYLNGTFQTNVTKGIQFFNGTGLTPDTAYTISTHTVDISGNVNQTWMNHTARTAPLPDTTPPASITSLQNTTFKQTYINWTWSDPSDADFSEVMVYLNGSFVTNITKGVQYYNASDLSSDSSYTISTHTVDTSGNVNQTWVNNTSITEPAPSSPSVTESGDLNNDGIVNFQDLIILSQHFGEVTLAPYPIYDINADGRVDITDILLVSNKIA